MRTTHPIVDPLSEYLTVAEAAALLKVHKSTIWRWIENGQLPAYRVGQRGVRLKKADLERSLTPVGQEKGGEQAVPEHERKVRPLTIKEQQRGLRALKEMQRLRAELTAQYGTLKPESWELVNASRDERTRELMDALKQ
jgi:excisionase family DNA binding protein